MTPRTILPQTEAIYWVFPDLHPFFAVDPGVMHKPATIDMPNA